MPKKVKLVLSMLAALVIGGFGWFNVGTMTHVGYAAFGLAALMVLAIWIFPEADGREAAADDR